MFDYIHVLGAIKKSSNVFRFQLGTGRRGEVSRELRLLRSEFCRDVLGIFAMTRKKDYDSSKTLFLTKWTERGHENVAQW